MRYTLKTIEAPTQYPVETEAMMRFVRLDTTNPAYTTTSDEGLFVEDLIGAATAMLEELTGRAFMTQVLEMVMTPVLRPGVTAGMSTYAYELLPDPIKLWRPPCQLVLGVYATDQAGTSYAQSSANYTVNYDQQPAEITLKEGGAWNYYNRGAYKIRYVAGYGDTIDDVPHQIRQAIRVTVAQWYAQRENMDYSLPTAAVDLISNLALEVRDL
jgi:hypothetical protein